MPDNTYPEPKQVFVPDLDLTAFETNDTLDVVLGNISEILGGISGIPPDSITNFELAPGSVLGACAGQTGFKGLVRSIAPNTLTTDDVKDGSISLADLSFTPDEVGTSSLSLIPAGAVLPFVGPAAPPGWHLCDGTALSVYAYPLLYEACGNKFAGVTSPPENSFRVPDLQARVVVGKDDYPVGTTGGSLEHTLTISEMPRHTHRIRTYTDIEGGSSPRLASQDRVATSDVGRDYTSFTGSGTPHDNKQPYLVLSWCIRLDPVPTVDLP